MTGKFLRFVPLKAGGTISCDIIAGTMKMARDWQNIVQPVIDASTEYRSDAGWNWPNLLRLTQGTERGLFRDCVYLQVSTVATGVRVPLGQLLLSVGYDFLPDTKRRSIYLWYLASAPVDYLNMQGVQEPKMLRALVDTAVQFSLMAGYEGRVCLHAMPCKDPKYHADLFNMYKGLGLTPIPLNQKIRKLTKPNDGRFFYCDENSWGGVSSVLDPLK